MNHHVRSIMGGTLTLIVLGLLVVGVRFGMAFTGPTAPGGTGSGALGVDAGNNISVGTSAPIADTKFYIRASSTANTAFSVKVLQPDTTSLFVVRNDRVIAIGQSIPAGVSTSTFIVGGNTLINGTLTATNISVSVSASNVTAGVFGTGNFTFPASLGIATTTQVSLPQELSIYGDAYLTGNIGLGVTNPGAKLHAIDSSASTTSQIILENNYGTPVDLAGAGIRFQRNGKPWAEIFGRQELTNDYGYGTLSFRTRTSDALGVQTKMTILANGNVGIGVTAPTTLLSVGGTTTGLVASFGGGTGKIDAGTIDPPYTINGKRYATYLPSMTGVKEETTGTIVCRASEKQQCTYVIDFTALPEGGDLWLFSKTTNLKNNFAKMTVLLTPGFDGTVWYEKDVNAKKLIIHAELASPGSVAEISYRLTAPRFDADQWPNADENGSPGFIIED